MAIDKQEINESALNLVIATKDHFKKLRQNSGLTSELKAAEKSYNNGSDSFYKGKAKVRNPVLHQAVERIVPKIDKVNFPPDGEFLGIKPKDTNDDISEDDAKATESLIKQQFVDTNVRSKLIGVYRDLCIYGTVFLKTFWDKRTVQRFKKIDGKRERIFDVVYDNPDFYCPNIWDIYIDPKDENLEGWLIEKIPVKFTDLWDLRKQTNEETKEEEGLYNKSALVELRDFSIKQDSDDKDKNESQELTGVGGHTYGPHEQKLFLWQAWGDIPKWYFTGSEKDREERTVVRNALIEIATTESGKGVVLRIVDNPFDHGEKPYLRGRYIRVNNKAYGLGVMSVNIPLEAKINTLVNQLIDMQTFNLKRKWIIDRSANINQSDLQDVNNQVIETDLMSGIKDIAPADFSASAQREIEQTKLDVQDSTGASKLLSGTPSGSSLDRTAAGVATVVSGGLEKFELVVTQFQEDVMKQLVRHYWMLDQQFLPNGRAVAITGKGIIKVDPSEIALDGFDLNFLGVRELGEKEFKVNALNILLQNLTPYIPLGLDPVPVVMRFFKLVGMGDLASEVDRRPETQLEETPEGEVQLLRFGRKVRIDFNDDHIEFLRAYEEAFLGELIQIDPVANPSEYITEFKNRLRASDQPENVQRNILEAVGQRQKVMQIIVDELKKTQGAPNFGTK